MCNVLHFRDYVSVNLCCSYGEKSVFFPSCTPYGHGKKKNKVARTAGRVLLCIVSLEQYNSRRSNATDAEPKTSEALHLHVMP